MPTTKKVYVNVSFADKEIAKRKGARYDQYSKSWYFDIDIHESLNGKTCRGFDIIEIINPPTFEEVFKQNLSDPFEDDDNDNEQTNDNTNNNINSITNLTNKLKELKILMRKCETIINELVN
jgi:hypothetical protein